VVDPGAVGVTSACCRITTGNGDGPASLVRMSNLEIAKPLSRAINIYRRVARHDLDPQTRRDVARHIKELAQQGEQDPDRLTVHGLSYLRRLERHARTR
jgi:hypothetical protein